MGWKGAIVLQCNSKKHHQPILHPSLPAEKHIAHPKAPKSALFSLSFPFKAFKARQDEIFRHFSIPSIRAKQRALRAWQPPRQCAGRGNRQHPYGRRPHHRHRSLRQRLLPLRPTDGQPNSKRRGLSVWL
jgi:hypothetical protein